MGDIKMCSLCGNSIPAEAVFCPNCGQKQEVIAQEPEQVMHTPESTVTNVDESIAPDTISGVDSQEVPEAGNQPEQVSQEPPVEATPTAQQYPVYPGPTAAPQQQPAAPKPEPVQQSYAQSYAQPQQPQPAYQPPSYGQPAQQPAAPAKPKKRFPWVFTILWIAMLAFIGVWVFMWTTYPDSENPLNSITVDTFRLITPVVSVVLLIYTLNLRLVVRKLKVIPTILLILSILLSVFMFLSFELVEGDWAHDLIRPVTEIFFEFD